MNNNIMAAVFSLALESVPNKELAAMNNGIQMNGKLDKINIAFDIAVEKKLIKENGYPFDIEALKDALAYQVNRRVEAGTFN